LTLKRFGSILSRLRIARGLTVVELANRAGVSHATINKGLASDACRWSARTKKAVLSALVSVARLSPAERDDAINSGLLSETQLRGDPSIVDETESAFSREIVEWTRRAALEHGERHTDAVRRIAEAMVRIMHYDDGMGGSNDDQVLRLCRRMTHRPRVDDGASNAQDAARPKPPRGAVRLDTGPVSIYQPLNQPARDQTQPKDSARPRKPPRAAQG
jgi:transcriptional regulator with XRE-family HTH domain